jgi:hypothetical protein
LANGRQANVQMDRFFVGGQQGRKLRHGNARHPELSHEAGSCLKLDMCLLSSQASATATPRRPLAPVNPTRVGQRLLIGHCCRWSAIAVTSRMIAPLLLGGTCVAGCRMTLPPPYGAPRARKPAARHRLVGQSNFSATLSRPRVNALSGRIELGRPRRAGCC